MSQILQIGWIAPRLVALCLCADVALRFLPADRFTFRATEAMNQFPGPYAPENGPFEPNKRYESNRSSGDLASYSNIHSMREYRREVFTADEHGFRNPKGWNFADPPAGILVGDSFSYGEGGITDEQTLSSQLGTMLGRPIYNAAGMDIIEPNRICAIARRLHIERGVVIHERAERIKPPEMARAPVTTPRDRGKFYSILRRAKVRFNGMWRISPVRVFCERGYKRLQNDRLLPNAHTWRAVLSPLRNGDSMLFVNEELRSHKQGDLEKTMAFWIWMSENLRKCNLTLLVVLIPDKYTVYESLMNPPRPYEKDFTYLDRLEEQLRLHGIPVVNMKSSLCSQAIEEFERGSYLYWRDDTHWNARGIELTAEEVKPVVQPLLQNQQAPASNPPR